MYIVTGNQILTHFKKIEGFEMNLGLNLKGSVNLNKNSTKQGEEPKIKIRDEFVKKYQNINNKIINKYGNIGSLKFYEEHSLKNEMHIYKDEQVFEIEIDDISLRSNPTEYLVNILKALENPDESEDVKDYIYTNLPEHIETPNMNLPKDQYIDALLKRRSIINDKLK